MGCGDFTIDTIDGMNSIISKDFTIGDYNGTFYRYNSKKNKLEQNNSTYKINVEC